VNSFPPSARWHKRDASSSSASSRYLKKSIRPHLLLRKGFPVSYLCAHRETREQVPPKPLLFAIPTRGVRQLGFWRATTRLLIHSQRHLLPLDADGNCTAITFLHRLRSTTSSTMATSANGASDALGMRPSAGYILFSSLCQFMVFMRYIVSVIFYMPWIYVILVLAGMFRLSCLYVF
jgi:hypothetical protein